MKRPPLLPPWQQHCSSLRSRLPFPQGAEAKLLPTAPNKCQVSAEGSSSLVLEISSQRALGTKPSGPYPQVSQGKGGCTPWGWLCRQHPPAMHTPAPTTGGLPSTTHQLTHLLPHSSQMSPCSDLHCPCTGCEGFTLLCSLLQHKGM